MGPYTQTSTSYPGADRMIKVGEDTKLAEFVGGKKRDFYLKKWNKDNSWNWAAFFLTFLWLGYIQKDVQADSNCNFSFPRN